MHASASILKNEHSLKPKQIPFQAPVQSGGDTAVSTISLTTRAENKSTKSIVSCVADDVTNLQCYV